MKNPFLLLEIKNKKGELHFRRYGIKTPWFGIFIHKIYKADNEAHRHNHPWNHIIFPLGGEYIEERQSPLNDQVDYLYRMFSWQPRWNWRQAHWYHRIYEIMKGPVTSLCIVGRTKYLPNGVEDWGYDVDGKHVNFVEYRKMKKEGKFE